MAGRLLKIGLTAVLAALAVAAGFLLASQIMPQKNVIAIDETATSAVMASANAESAGSADSFSQELPFLNLLPLNNSLVFGGDVMLSRVVGQKMVKYKNFNWPFEKIKSILSPADIAVINLESPFTSGSKSYLVPTGSFSFNADPRALAGLETSGIDLVTLANNHFANQGGKGMRDTFSLLEAKGIKYVGAGNDSAKSHEAKIIEKNGIKFGFLGYAYPDDASVAGSDRPGIAGMDLSLAKADIKIIREQADVVIILIHDGVEYTNQPSAHQKEFARAMISAGADLVVGHHPHWVQQVEIYQGKPIIYSLGNLVFDQMWSQETREGALVKIDFSGPEISRLEFIPLLIQDYGQPTVVTDETQKNKILKRMGLSSAIIDFK